MEWASTSTTDQFRLSRRVTTTYFLWRAPHTYFSCELAAELTGRDASLLWMYGNVTVPKCNLSLTLWKALFHIHLSIYLSRKVAYLADYFLSAIKITNHISCKHSKKWNWSNLVALCWKLWHQKVTEVMMTCVWTHVDILIVWIKNPDKEALSRLYVWLYGGAGHIQW